MSIVISLFREEPYIIGPPDFVGWAGIFIWTMIIVFILWRYHKHQKSWEKLKSLRFVALVLAIPITNYFLGIRFSNLISQPYPGGPVETGEVSIMLLSAIPWVLAAGMMRPIPAVAIGIGSGTIIAFWITHSPLTIFEIAFLAFILSIFSFQRYRNKFYRFLRQPFIAALAVSLIYPLIFLVNRIYFGGGDVATRMDFASNNFLSTTLVVVIPLWIAGIFSQLVSYAFPIVWGGKPPWKHSPAEASFLIRSLRNAFPIISILVIFLVFFGWKSIQDQSEDVLVNQMMIAAASTAESIPPFLDLGKNLLMQIVDSIPTELDSPGELNLALEDLIQELPYFNQLFVIDRNGNSIGGFPNQTFDPQSASLDELTGMDLAFNGFQNQMVVLPPDEPNGSIKISFIAPIKDEVGAISGVIIGRTELLTNPHAKGILKSLLSMSDLGGTGFLVDETNRIVFHEDTDRFLEDYPNIQGDEGGYSRITTAEGDLNLIYTLPVDGPSWTIVMSIPMRASLRLSLIQAAPITGILLTASIISVIVFCFSLKPVTSSLKSLIDEVDSIRGGNLDQPVQFHKMDEIGQLRKSVEQMRVRLKGRSDEFNKLLSVSHGIVKSSTLEKGFRAIIENGTSLGASSSRILLSSKAVPKISPLANFQTRFGYGRLSHVYQSLDDQILELMETQDRIVVPNTNRTTLIKFEKGVVIPGSLLALPIRYADQYYGVFWIAYSQEHLFTPIEVEFMTSLSKEAALAAFKHLSVLFDEFNHLRLTKILESIPIPIFVIDHNDQLILINSFSRNVFKIDSEEVLGKSVKDAVHQPDLIDLIQTSTSSIDSREIIFPDGKTHLVSIVPVLFDETSLGKLCFLYDITRFKELDSLKSVFVATASHDLRSSLTLLRGYTKMLSTSGELNKQQESYVRKLLNGVESMSRLINNLLDLGRIEADIGLRLQTLPVQDVFDEVINALQMKANQKRVRINFEPENLFLPLIEADHVMLYQAFLNLLDNAIKFSPDGKDVWIRIKNFGEKMVFSFEDQGVGISAIDRPRLFDKFFRSAQKESRREGGSGLGLAIVKSVAERHGGRVWAESQLGKGSTFYFEIPIRQKKQV